MAGAAGNSAAPRRRAAGRLYLVKPFAFDKLLARLRALARRGDAGRSVSLVVGDLTIDPTRRGVHRGETEVVLTRQEYTLLEAMARRSGQVLSRDRLLHLAWDMAYQPRSNVVEVYVKGLRDRIDLPFGRHSLQTVRGFGYRLVEDSP